jgi:SAM-dependent methyltransferase
MCGAKLVALDYSYAVDATWANLGPHPNLEVVQGDIHKPPFKLGSFDYAYCFGVLQHTPDVHKAFLMLPRLLKDGGRLAVDVYPELLLNLLWPKYWIRPFTRNLDEEKLISLVEKLVKYLLPVSLLVGRIPKLGRKLRYAIPVVNYEGIFPLSKKQLEEWAVLDTFDMLGATYDYPQSLDTLREWFEEAGMQAVEIFRSGFNVGRGTKPSSDFGSET